MIMMLVIINYDDKGFDAYDDNGGEVLLMLDADNDADTDDTAAGGGDNDDDHDDVKTCPTIELSLLFGYYYHIYYNG